MVNPFCITDYALGTYAVRWVGEADYEWTKQKRWKTEQTAMKSKRKPYVWGYVCGEGRERTTRLLQNFSAALSFVTKGCTPGCSRWIRVHHRPHRCHVALDPWKTATWNLTACNCSRWLERRTTRSCATFCSRGMSPICFLTCKVCTCKHTYIHAYCTCMRKYVRMYVCSYVPYVNKAKHRRW